MSIKPEEFNVFKIPHSRMKQLVKSCNQNLDTTDFANNDALIMLLANLGTIFHEFKLHEEIENEHIMIKLKTKLTAMAIYNSAVCNCHKDDEFSPLINLVEAGYMYLNKTKSISEKISFGLRLRKALNKFFKKFLPHMKEEEEVFQPLLFEHFTEEELHEMKNIVIKLHMQQRKRPHGAKRARCEPKMKNLASDRPNSNYINQLPDELLLKIFSLLSTSDKLRSAQACRKWNKLIYDPCNWTYLDFNQWKSKNRSLSKVNVNCSNAQFKEMDFIDESDEDDFDNSSSIDINDIKTLQYWIRNLLPKIGVFVQKLNLSNCSSLNNNLARRILQLCPNLIELNIGYNTIGDNSFRGVRLDKLRSLNCEGCQNLTDDAFKFLLISNKIKSNTSCLLDPTIKCDPSGDQIKEIESGDKNICEKCAKHQEFNNKSSLISINLSGCWSISDYSLSFLASKYELNDLEYLNLSGCVNVTSFGMNLFLEFSDMLKGENLFYCDNITDGPLSDTANGCENLECAKKYCCRSIGRGYGC
ncbi:F-box LRR-repeat 5-like [Brachionus plicatilis]|uniref:F-box LRR-repeat 5-like n=1 Tax=Brachionus plicatilis TaxID=10195 RepID=A0A3M7QAF9_BRAPC|nr:F-box LRR-repeat 5-like [Brachionus plicatilis]